MLSASAFEFWKDKPMHTCMCTWKHRCMYMIKVIKPHAHSGLFSMVEITAVKCTRCFDLHHSQASFKYLTLRADGEVCTEPESQVTALRISAQTDYAAVPGISKPGCGVTRSIQRLCFMVSPYSGVISSISPGIPLNFNLWRRMARNRKTSARPMDSPMQRRFPSPKTNTFSPSILFRSVPSAVRNRSGLKLDGSFHSSLQEEAASFKSTLHHLPSTFKSLWETYGSWLTCHWFTNTQVSLGMKYPLSDVSLDVLEYKNTSNHWHGQFW